MAEKSHWYQMGQAAASAGIPMSAKPWSAYVNNMIDWRLGWTDRTDELRDELSRARTRPSTATRPGL